MALALLTCSRVSSPERALLSLYSRPKERELSVSSSPMGVRASSGRSSAGAPQQPAGPEPEATRSMAAATIDMQRTIPRLRLPWHDAPPYLCWLTWHQVICWPAALAPACSTIPMTSRMAVPAVITSSMISTLPSRGAPTREPPSP